MNNYAGQCGWREHSSASLVLPRGEGLWRLVAMIGALHVAVVSFALGPRCLAYIGAAYLSAVVVWGGVAMSARKRRVAVMVGAGLTVAVQQAAYQAWKAELGGVWWAVVQFLALEWLIGAGVQRAIRYALGWGVSGPQDAQGRGSVPSGSTEFGEASRRRDPGTVTTGQGAMKGSVV
jgi:hypothetical protein